jgi:hypothetical protein
MGVSSLAGVVRWGKPYRRRGPLRGACLRLAVCWPPVTGRQRRMPYAGFPSQVDSAGHPPGVALLYTRAWGHVVYSRATPGGWPAVPGRIRGIRQASIGRPTDGLPVTRGVGQPVGERGCCSQSMALLPLISRPGVRWWSVGGGCTRRPGTSLPDGVQPQGAGQVYRARKNTKGEEPGTALSTTR